MSLDQLGLLFSVSRSCGKRILASACACVAVDAGLESADSGEHVAVIANVVHDGGDEDVLLGAGRKDGREIEGGGENADDGEGAIIESDGAADDGGIGGVLAAPESVREQNGGRASLGAFIGSEETAELRLDAESLEKISGDVHGRDGLGLIAAAEYEIGVGEEWDVSSDGLKRFVVALEGFEGIDAIGDI